MHLMAFGRKLVGIIEGEAVSDIFIPMLIDFHLQGRFPFDRLVQFYELDQIEQAIQDALSGKVLKPVLRMSS